MLMGYSLPPHKIINSNKIILKSVAEEEKYHDHIKLSSTISVLQLKYPKKSAPEKL